MTGIKDWRDLAAIAPALPDSKLLQVLTLLDRLPEAERPSGVLEAMRPRLAQLKPARRLTVQRLLFRPVEDLFDPPELYRRRIGRLSRRTIKPVWSLVSQRLPPTVMAEAVAGLNTVSATDTASANRIGARLWPAAAVALRDALEIAVTDRRQWVGWFGRDDDIERQVADVAATFEVGFAVEETKARLPARPIETLSDGHLEVIRTILIPLSRQTPEQVKMFLVVLSARMVRPGILMDMLSEVKWSSSVQEHEGMMRLIETNLVETLVHHARNLSVAAALPAGADHATRLAQQLVDGLASLQQKNRVRANAELMLALRQARAEIGQFILGSVVAEADQTLRAILAPGTSPDDLADGPSDRQLEEAELFALALRRCANLAPAVGIDEGVRVKLGGIQAELERIGLTPKDPTLAARWLLTTVRLLEVLAGPDEAERVLHLGLRRFGATTGNGAAPA